MAVGGLGFINAEDGDGEDDAQIVIFQNFVDYLYG